MILVIGGNSQGKLAYGLSLLADETGREQIADGRSCGLEDGLLAPVLHHFHALVKRMLEQGEDPSRFVDRLLEENPEVLIVTDEIGNGIVPLDPMERQWRETTGRLCCRLAKESKEVHRVFCGIGTRLA